MTHARADDGRGRPLPHSTPVTEPYWAAARNGELRLQRCGACLHYVFPPRLFCPSCGSREPKPTWSLLSGAATLVSYVVARVSTPGGYDEVPYIVALIELEEGPRLMTNVTDVDPDEELPLGMPLTVAFESRGDASVPVFRPARRK
jgi:uncharacterized OB-fold protein